MGTVRPAVRGKPAAKKFNFQYRPRTAEEMKKRATQTGGGRDTFLDGRIKLFNPKSGDFKVRVLPPTWEDAEHFGLEVFVHYGIGPDNAGYLCLHKMKGEACPLCEARKEAEVAGDIEMLKALRPTKRVLMYLIDRAHEGDGPLAWASPWSKFDKELCAQAYDPDSGAAVPVDDPDEGFDVMFSVEGSAQQKDYVGVKIARSPRPLSDDSDTAMEWLQFISENPLPETLVYHSYDHMKEAFEGKAAAEVPPEDEQPAASSSRRSRKSAPATDDPPASSKRPRLGAAPPADDPEPEAGGEEEGAAPTWDEIHEMDINQIGDLGEANGIEFPEESLPTVEAWQDWICEQLGIEPAEEEPAPPPAKKSGTRPTTRPTTAATPAAPKSGGTLRDRLASLNRGKK